MKLPLSKLHTAILACVAAAIGLIVLSLGSHRPLPGGSGISPGNSKAESPAAAESNASASQPRVAAESPAPDAAGSPQAPASHAANLPDAQPQGAPSGAMTASGIVDPLPEREAFRGEHTIAVAEVDGARSPDLYPNTWGAYPRVYIPARGSGTVTIQFPDAQTGDQVVAAVNDGGHFASGKPYQAFTLDASRRVQFQFFANQAIGNYRVSVRHAGQTMTVQFWAGDRALAANR